MGKKTKGQKLAAALARDHRAELSDAERRNIEQMLGPGAIRFRLDASGTKRLFAALGAASAETSEETGGGKQ